MPQLPASTPLGFPFVELQSVDSTNKYAMNLVHKGMASHGMAIFAHAQTAGLGQRGKTWHSETGKNIALSLIVNPFPIKTFENFKLSYCVAVSVANFLKKIVGDEIKIKWPNDIYWRDRKAGGILIENKVKTSEANNSNWQWAVIGIGLNINQTLFSNDLPNPFSLKQITGKDFDVVELAKSLCAEMNTFFNALITDKSSLLLEQYTSLLYKKDEKVKFKKGLRIFEATIKGVSETGQLITQHAIEERFDFGEIEWLLEKTI